MCNQGNEIKPGAIVELFAIERSHMTQGRNGMYDFRDWNGFRARVVDTNGYGAELEPLSERPDGYSQYAWFNWEVDKMVVVVPAPGD